MFRYESLKSQFEWHFLGRIYIRSAPVIVYTVAKRYIIVHNEDRRMKMPGN